MNKTWMLFEDGSETLVDCRVSPAAEGRGTVSAYVIPDPGSGEVIKAADSGVNAVHNWCMARGMASHAATAKFAFEGSRHHRASMSGLSGGVSFALSFARAYLDTPLPNIAATGAIDGHETVVGIKGMENKAGAALTLLSPGDYFFYPRANGDDIPGRILDALGAKGVHCHAIDTVSQALDILLDSPQVSCTKTDAGGKGSKIFKILALLLILAGLGLSIFLFQKGPGDAIVAPGAVSEDPAPPVVPAEPDTGGIGDTLPAPLPENGAKPVMVKDPGPDSEQAVDREKMKKVVEEANKDGWY